MSIKLLKQKKGYLFWYTIMGGLTVLIFTSFLIPPAKVINYIGERPLKVIKTSVDAEKTLYYIDTSAKYAVQQSIYEFADKESCDISKDKCFEKKEFELIFNKNLNNYLDQYPYVNIPVNKYHYSINFNNNKTKILGFALANIEIEETKSTDNSNEEGITKQSTLIIYSIKPNFKVELDFDFNIFSNIKQQAKTILDKCSDESNIESCVEGNIITFNTNSEIEWSKEKIDEHTFKFNVNTHEKLYPFNDEVIIKFKLNFPQTTQ